MSNTKISIGEAMKMQSKMANRLDPTRYIRASQIDYGHLSTVQQIANRIGVTSRLIEKSAIAFQANQLFSPQVKSLVEHYIKFSEIGINWDNIRRGIIETEEDVKVFKAAMIEMGYPPHHGLSIRQMRLIAKEFRKDSTEVTNSIDEIMNILYNPIKLKELLLGWEGIEILEKRLPLLRNAIMAHNLGMFDLVVPSVLSQLEGFLVDLFKIKGKVNGKVQTILLNNLLLYEREVDSAFNFDDEIHEYYSRNILANFEHGKSLSSDLSRHAILHGADSNYGKQSISLKILLLFDFLVAASKDLSEDQIKNAKREILEISKRKNRKTI